MDRSAMPWRVLEDSPAGDPADGRNGAVPGDQVVQPRISWAVIGGFGLAAVLAVGAFAIAASSPRGEITVDGGASWIASDAPGGSGVPSSPGSALVVDVQGAVLHPGLRELEPGSRVGDAIAAAGGYGPRVDAERAAGELNLAAVVKDGDRIVIPSRDDPLPASGPSSSGATGATGPAGGLVDLNARHGLGARCAAGCRPGHRPEDHRRPGGEALRVRR